MAMDDTITSDSLDLWGGLAHEFPLLLMQQGIAHLGHKGLPI